LLFIIFALFLQSEPPPEAVKSSPALEASEKTQSKSLFSDDEASQVRHFSIVMIQRACSQFSSLFKLVLCHLFNIQVFDEKNENVVITYSPSCCSKPI